MSGFHHVPVLRDEVVRALAPRSGEIFVDCTVGGGGHALALLEAAPCRVIGLDRDPAALRAARGRCAPYGERFSAIQGSFSSLASVLDHLGIDRVDGVLADLGVSSHQLDTASRGFSLQRSGPIDMRMDPSAPLSASEIVNTYDQRELIEILRTYGEERRARRVAAAIVSGRPWSDTRALARAVAAAVGGGGRRIHPATRTFQALRIATNSELSELEALLPVAVERLARGGRLAIISFHSLEDRIVKRFFAAGAGKDLPRDAWGNRVGEISLELRAPVVPDPSDPNPRSRSARLRAAVRRP